MNKYLMQRGWMEMPFFADEPYTEREAFAWMIETAVWKDCRVRRGNMIVDLKRGQLAFSERFLADKWRWTSSRVHRFINRLKIEALIEADAKRIINIITICNYSELQDFDGEGHKQSEAANEAAPKQRRSKEEHQITPDKHQVRDTTPDPASPNAPEPRSKKQSQLAQNWKPTDEHAAKCKEFGLNPDQLAEEFANYHLARASKFADWDRAFWTWIGNAKKFSAERKNPQFGGPKPPNPSIAEIGLRVAARYQNPL